MARFLVILALSAVIGTVVCIDLTIGRDFGKLIGQTTSNWSSYAILGAAVVAVKCLTPIALGMALISRQWLGAAAAALVAIVSCGYSITANLGYSAVNSERLAKSASADGQVAANKRTELKEAEEKLRTMERSRLVGEIAPELAAIQKKKGMEADRAILEGELTRAHERIRLETVITEYRRALEKPEAHASTIHPWIATLVSISGYEPERVTKALGILLVLTIETITLLGGVVLGSLMADGRKAEEMEPAPLPEDFGDGGTPVTGREGQSWNVPFMPISEQAPTAPMPPVAPIAPDNITPIRKPAAASQGRAVLPILRNLSDAQIAEVEQAIGQALADFNDFAPTDEVAQRVARLTGVPVDSRRVGALLSMRKLQPIRRGGRRGFQIKKAA